MSKVSTLMFLGALSLAGLSSAAVAHPKLTQTAPEANAIVATGPNEIRLTFNESLEASFSGAEIKNEGGKKIETGKVSTDPKNPKQLVIPLSAPLAPGAYKVTWHAVASDSHRVKGSYSFTVKP